MIQQKGILSWFNSFKFDSIACLDLLFINSGFTYLLKVNKYIDVCKDQFRLRSNTGMDPGPRSPNNEFVECRKKSQSDLGPKYWVLV